jgi:hypothetical protein
MSRVLEGGVGCWSGGMAERSIDSGERPRDDRLEEMGDVDADILNAMRSFDGCEEVEDGLEETVRFVSSFRFRVYFVCGCVLLMFCGLLE